MLCDLVGISCAAGKCTAEASAYVSITVAYGMMRVLDLHPVDAASAP